MPFQITPPPANCPFCEEQVLREATATVRLVVAVPDKYPATPGHLLIIPRRHTPEYFTMTPEERRDADELICTLREEILRSDPTVAGFNIGVNCGESAGQTIQHAHIHFIPRRFGDTPNPQGGVRGAIPARMSY